MSIQVKAYHYFGDPRVINKHMAPGEPLTIECRITDPTDVMNPVLLVSDANSIEKYNYFTLGQRKYFKTGVTKVHNKMLKIRLHEDVLSTWMPYMQIYGKITNASMIDKYFLDQNYMKDVDHKISRLRISNNYEEVKTDPAIIIQSPLPTQDKLSS